MDFREIHKDPGAGSGAALDEIIEAEAARFIDLERALPVRWVLIAIRGQPPVLLLMAHHIIADAWSVVTAITELGAFYREEMGGAAADLPPPARGFHQFIREQTAWLGTPEAERQRVFWKETLSGPVPPLDLPVDRPRPLDDASFKTDGLPFAIPKVLQAGMRKLASSMGVRPLAVWLAAWFVFLYRLSGQRPDGQTPLITTLPVAGRGQAYKGVLGFFANALPVRVACSGEASFRTFLNHTAEALKAALTHRDWPFPLMIPDLDRDTRSALSRTGFSWHDYNYFGDDFRKRQPPLVTPLGAVGDLWHVGDMDWELARFWHQPEETIIELWVMNLPDHQYGLLQYSSALFHRATLERWSGHFVRLLEGIVAEPETPIGKLPLLTDAERQRILVAWNRTSVPYPTDQCVHRLFEEQAARTPDAVALVLGETAISYRELNARANRLAHRLRALIPRATNTPLNDPQRPSDTEENHRRISPCAAPSLSAALGLFVERSVEMVVGLLAILKAGGTYVPLDPDYPAERLAFLMEDAGLGVLVCHGATRERLPECPVPVLDMDAEAAAMASEPPENPTPRVSANDLAYIIYTSGSTGRPKGVMVEHGSLTNLAWAQREALGITPTDRVLQFAALSVDTALEQIFSAFLGGATLVPRGPRIWTVEECWREVRRAGVTVADLPSGYLHEFLAFAVDTRSPARPLRRVINGGEVLSPATVALSQRLGLPLFNAYGPTEATITATLFRFSGVDSPGEQEIIPIGYPIPNTRTYILDDALQPVPMGIAGELYIGGVGVARGYLNRPDFTARRFIPDPFRDDTAANTGDARLYRTGDRCRWLPDGNIEFLGRMDTQVKIRGFRMECGEIEQALLSHPGVRQAAVDVRGGEGADKRLIAWVVADGAAEGHGGQPVLRAHLQKGLPEWMVPASFVFMKALPLAPSGKIDRRALPDPDREEMTSSMEYAAPRTALETRMARLWAETLGADRVGLRDNFFNLGGHSLLGIRLIARIKASLGMDLSLEALFRRPTVSGLLETLGGAAEEPAVDLEAEARLDEDIRPTTPILAAHLPEEPQNIFLTGATGFLGVYLVGELLRRTRATLRCLVRGENRQQAEAGLHAALAAHGQLTDDGRGRVRVVVGDLKQRQLGLSPQAFRTLADTIQVIYHGGAEVNHLYPYRELRKANVVGTKEVLRLACAGAAKPVHHVSTIDVFPPTLAIVREESTPQAEGVIENGYIQSKWVAEKLIWQAGERGLPVAVYRTSRLGGHSETGQWQDEDALYRLLKASIAQGVVPDWDAREDIVPVDYAAKALVWLSLRRQTPGRAYHLVNPEPISWRTIANYLGARGLPVRPVPYPVWRARVGGADQGLVGQWLDHVIGDEGARPEGVGKMSGGQTIHCRQTRQALLEGGIPCPSITGEVLARMVR